MVSQTASRPSLCIIPEPKQVQWSEGAFQLDAQTWIVLLPGAGEREHLAARTLQEEIRAETGLHLPIVATARSVRTDNLILLTSDLAAASAFLGDPSLTAGDVSAHGDQAYLIQITPGCVIAGGQGCTALQYAAQTLRQLVRSEHTTWPSMSLIDWPSLPYRGLMMDVCRGKVPTLETLNRVVDELSLYKANVLQLYTEHTFVFPHHPRIGEGCGSLSADDIMALDDYARPRGVTLMPNLQSFGHCAHILSLPEYRPLAEHDAALWSLCPQDERTYAFLDDLYGDLLGGFSAKTLNIGCDETYDLGKGRSAQAVAQKGLGRVYLDHILRVHELAKKHGCRIQMWGDILLHHPELVSEVPEDVTLLDWHYEAAEDYPSVRIFAASGRSFWVCPGTSSWNTLFPRIENANGNIRTLARLGAEQGATGFLNTDWGDRGHYQPIGQCWYGYVYGCEQAWSGGMTSDDDFDARFGKLFFGAGGDAVARTIRALGRLNVLPGMARSNATNSIFALVDEPLVGPMIDKLPKATLEEIARVCTEAERALGDAVSSSRERLSIEEMIYSSRMMGYAARKVLACQGIHAELDALARGEGDAVATLCKAVQTLRALDIEFVGLIELFRETWLARARYSEIDISLGHWDALRERLHLAEAWLSARLAEAEAGKAPNYDLVRYTEETGSYEALGMRENRRLRAAGVV